jgi:glycosyltransferase involved in cell wall biosynthesis
LDQFIRRGPSTIVRGDPYYCGLLALLLGKLNRRPVEVRIIANHDALYKATGELAYPRLFRRRSVEERVARFVLSHADAVVVGSDDNAQFALANHACPERLIFCADLAMINPVHLTKPKEREAFDDEFGLGDRPVVVCVSRLERSKHVGDVVEALAIAREQRPDLIGLLVGAGSREEELRQRCQELGVAEHTILAGERDQPWIARLLPRCTVVAAPLSGLALVESALSETPIVAYDVEWHSELLQTEQTAILVPFNDCRAMATAICELVNDRPRARRLGTAARRHALEVVDYGKQVEQERALADQLLNIRDSAD